MTLLVSAFWPFLIAVIGLTVARNSSGDDLITSATSETCRPVIVVPLMSRISSPVCEWVCVCVQRWGWVWWVNGDEIFTDVPSYTGDILGHTEMMYQVILVIYWATQRWRTKLYRWYTGPHRDDVPSYTGDILGHTEMMYQVILVIYWAIGVDRKFVPVSPPHY